MYEYSGVRNSPWGTAAVSSHGCRILPESRLVLREGGVNPSVSYLHVIVVNDSAYTYRV